MAKVFIGAPVRNRAWIMERHLQSLKQQTVHKQFLYILNDSEDQTEQILNDHQISYLTHNLGKTFGHLRGQYSYHNLALLRNILVMEFLKSDCDYLFSIDTDIIIPEQSLEQLIENDKDICAMLIRNHPRIKAYNAMIGGKHISDFREGVIPVDLTGAVYLIKREVVEAGVRYGSHSIGEDAPFCEQAQQLGYELYVDTRLRPVHAYEKGVELVAELAST
ncbi:glycosyltransferase family 2 protein [Paenibacillus sp. FSL K6-0108]|uniref:glycosyltransferase family 2 protein n=1 Tax=Paenibacillus sp. FSL K6-0108 TaxID=2921417 RepID=UPI00324DAAB5